MAHLHRGQLDQHPARANHGTVGVAGDEAVVRSTQLGAQALTDRDRQLRLVAEEFHEPIGPDLGHHRRIERRGARRPGATVECRQLAELVARRLDPDEQLSARAAYRRTFQRLGDLLSGLARSLVFVALLLVSIVGIPWGIRQLVRYQFLSPAVALEGLGSQTALDRSSRLVRGRWLHVAGVVLLLNGVVALVNAVVGLLLLLVLSGLPLWAFSVIVTVFAALVVPYASIGLILLYGDAVAQDDGIEVAEPLEPAGGART